MTDTPAATADTQKPNLSEKDLNALREIHISIDWKGFKKAWKKIFHDAPLGAHQKILRGIEGVSRNWMTGKASLVGMPAGIVLRNTTRGMYNFVDNHYWKSGSAVGVLGAVGAVAVATYLGGPIVAGLVGAKVMGAVGAWASYVAAGAVAAAVVPVPAYTTATLITSSIIGTTCFAFSTVLSAPINLLGGPAWKRYKMAKQGVALTEDQIEKLQTEFDKDSPSVRYEREAFDTIRRTFNNLSAPRQKVIMADLTKEMAEKEERTTPKRGAKAAQATA